jgi:hypothetical protein
MLNDVPGSYRLAPVYGEPSFRVAAHQALLATAN